MKKHFLWYLLSFAGLLLIFQFINANKVFDSNVKKIEALEARVQKYKDSTRQLIIKNQDLLYFDLKNNDDALAYYYHLDLEDPEAFIMDKLLETNEKKGDNDLVPYAGMEGVFKINKIKVLNHKWILADFSDGKYWGELLLNYELRDDLSVSFTLTDHLLYNRSN